MDAFTVLADPSRRVMLDLLRRKGRSVAELNAALPKLTQPAVSRHLKILRDAGLVSSRAVAQKRVYTLRASGLKEIEAWLAPYRKLWSMKLDALDDYLDKKAKKNG